MILQKCAAWSAATVLALLMDLSCATHAAVAAIATDPSTLCDRSAQRAADATGVPANILFAISRVETGRDTGRGPEPWPWAVNQAGKGHWFPTEGDAVEFVTSELAQGASNIDIGCFQLNYRWHSGRFSTLADMFDPDENALQAARFLAELQKEGRDWRGAVAAYHSRSQGPAEVYLARFDSVVAGASVAVPSVQGDRENFFPLLRIGQKGGNGSLVPVLASNGSLIRLMQDPNP